MDVRICDTIIAFLEEYNRHFSAVVLFLTEKQNRILLDDLKWLEQSLVDEQSFVMKSASLEQKRMDLFKQCRVENYDFDRLEKVFPEEKRPLLRLQRDRMRDSVAKIKRLNEVSTDLVERKLEVQAKLLGVNDLTGIGTYSEDARRVKKIGGGDFIGSV